MTVADDRTPPTWEAFEAAPMSDVITLAPQSLLMAIGGSRRVAALAGVGPHTDAYAHYSRDHIMALITRLFDHGVAHVFTTAIRPRPAC